VVIINACGAPLTPLIAMTAVINAQREQKLPTEARANEAQRVMWRNAAISANACVFDPEEFPDLCEKQTLAGLPLLLDASLPLSWIELRDNAGNTVARIENLAIPNDFH
jgi:hypothetical protein